jgi:pimeloyl-ACP methyl ester carboxylesterase
MGMERFKLLGLGLTGGLMLAVIASCTSSHESPTPDVANALPVGGKTRCEEIAGAQISGTAIDGATYVEADGVVFEYKPFVLKAPASFCRVTVSLTSGPGSSIKSEFWLPDSWNGKFVGMGGGGFNGSLTISGVVLRAPLGQGYASATSDAGHTMADGASWAQNDPVKVADFGNRANHATAVFGKALLAAYYGQAPKRSYFEGCSNGGRDALMLAQRYPDDFDGIIAGAPAGYWSDMTAAFVANQNELKIFGDTLDAKLKAVHDTILAKCDALDGVRDGILERPGQCAFDPSAMQCKTGETAGCLSQAEADALRTVYLGRRLSDGSQLYPGFSVGSEMEAGGWRDVKAGTGQLGIEFYRWMVYGDADWSADKFEVNRDHAAGRDRAGPLVDARNPDIAAFTRRGGKLLLWHGWNDALIPAGSTIKYYRAVEAKLGAETGSSVRLFMAPGVNHCGGGDGPGNFDKLGQIDRWIESGNPPSRIVATKYDNDTFYAAGLPAKPVRTRPLCAWPQTAHYNGAGSTDDAANFTCRDE